LVVRLLTIRTMNRSSAAKDSTDIDTPPQSSRKRVDIYTLLCIEVYHEGEEERRYGERRAPLRCRCLRAA
jgi:hypothetical protein